MCYLQVYKKHIKIKNMNSKQKLILGILIPLILFFICLKIAGQVGGIAYYSVEPFKFEKTWWVWILYLIIVGIAEFKLFKE